ncbi:hypothetical protein L249_0426 [Ophiocordyceps polyrhachis-furcata BCC 54312]|uniref:Uncharacterized protein n=1 Tax=Ophiocordyceps polyrhachis-furcata BCC 54312 TaxID=1330021 RepID=A0A367LFE5_9HYPO|nr:hypothetical protein L249_0426 [Ophiocordyceps polyrhachis-furcata BCC 54312]
MTVVFDFWLRRDALQLVLIRATAYIIIRLYCSPFHESQTTLLCIVLRISCSQHQQQQTNPMIGVKRGRKEITTIKSTSIPLSEQQTSTPDQTIKLLSPKLLPPQPVSGTNTFVRNAITNGPSLLEEEELRSRFETLLEAVGPGSAPLENDDMKMIGETILGYTQYGSGLAIDLWKDLDIVFFMWERKRQAENDTDEMSDLSTEIEAAQVDRNLRRQRETGGVVALSLYHDIIVIHGGMCGKNRITAGKLPTLRSIKPLSPSVSRMSHPAPGQLPIPDFNHLRELLSNCHRDLRIVYQSLSDIRDDITSRMRQSQRPIPRSVVRLYRKLDDFVGIAWNDYVRVGMDMIKVDELAQAWLSAWQGMQRIYAHPI